MLSVEAERIIFGSDVHGVTLSSTPRGWPHRYHLGIQDQDILPTEIMWTSSSSLSSLVFINQFTSICHVARVVILNYNSRWAGWVRRIPQREREWFAAWLHQRHMALLVFTGTQFPRLRGNLLMEKIVDGSAISHGLNRIPCWSLYEEWFQKWLRCKQWQFLNSNLKLFSTAPRMLLTS